MRLPAALFLALTGLACGSGADMDVYVARVGDQQLTRAAVDEALQSVGTVLDSAEASRQFVDQWVTSELLFVEASRRGLRNDPQVRRRIAESERSVLISAMLEQIYKNSAAATPASEIRNYFEEHRDQLGLVEPFVRVRYLALGNPDSALVARRRLAALDTSDTAEWAALAARFAADPDASIDLSSSYAAESQLTTNLPQVREALRTLRPGRTSPVVEDAGRYHAIQLVDRVPAGTVPRVEWIEDALSQRLQIESRKQLFARLVQDLRTEALASEFLEIR